MRNLKKFLALVLAMMMVFSLMITVSAADAFTDADLVKESKYAKAIDTPHEYGVLKGDKNGNFNPDGEFSRAEMAGIAYRIATGDVEGKLEKQNAIYAQKFTDVGENHWAAPYIGFCANWGIVNCVNAGSDAIQTGISANLVDFDMSAVAHRDAVAQMAYDAALNTNRVQYSGGSYKALETEKDLIATVTTKTEYTADTIWGGVTSKTTRTVDFTWREGNERVTLTGSEVRALGTWYGPVPECDVYASAKKGNTAKATITATTYLNGIDNENLNAVNLVEYTDYGMGMADQLLFYSIRQKSQRCTKKRPFTFCADGRIFVSFTKRLC